MREGTGSGLMAYGTSPLPRHFRVEARFRARSSRWTVFFHDLVATSAAVGETSSRLAKIGLLADLLRRLGPDETEMAIGFLSGEPRQGRIGIGGAAIWSAKDVVGAETPTLTL